jgi:hypothetical protein
MSNVTPIRPDLEAWEIWPGYAPINRAGATLARDMLIELESINDPDEDGPNIAELSTLENWAREGRPLRNVLAEYAARAQAAGPDVLDGFYALLGDYIAIACQGSIADIGCRYDRHCEDAQEGD